MLALEQPKKPVNLKEQNRLYVGFSYKAILNPIQYDNNELWSLLRKEEIESKTIRYLAERIPQEHWHTLLCADGSHISYPSPQLFLIKAFSINKNLTEKLKLIFEKSTYKKYLETHRTLVNDVLAMEQYPENKEEKKLHITKESSYWGHPKNTNSHHRWDMFLLSVFIAAIGIGAIAIGLTVLINAAAITALIVGGVASVGAVGLFAYSTYKYVQKNSFSDSTDNRHKP